jgi:hypothetical protein
MAIADLVPDISNRTLITIRGKVIKHCIDPEYGVHGINVRINADQLNILNEMKLQLFADNLPITISDVIFIGVKKSKLYPVKAEVGITFGYADVLEQFEKGSRPLKLKSLKVISSDIHIENEVPLSTPLTTENNFQGLSTD